MTTIRDVVSAFAAIEEGLSITDPRSVQIKRVYKYLPPSTDALETPCVIHQYRPMEEARRPNENQQRRYAVRIQVLLAKFGPDTDVWSEIAAAFDEKFVNAYDGNILLGASNAAHQRMFDFGGQEYQPSLLEWNGINYIGLQYEYEVRVQNVVTMGA